MNKDCVINPKTGRAVKIGSVAGKKVMKTDPTPTHDCVINPKTGRAVKNTGAVGKKIIGASTTITQAVKMKIARKNLEKAKMEAKPKTPPPAPKPNPMGGKTRKKAPKEPKEPKKAKAETPPKDSEMNVDEAYELIDKYVEIMTLQKRIRDKGKQNRLSLDTHILPSFMGREKRIKFLKDMEKEVAKWERNNDGNYLRWDLGKDLKYSNNIDFMYDVFKKAMMLEPDNRLKYFFNLQGVSGTEAVILMKKLEHLSGKKRGGEIDKYFIQ